MLDLSLQKKVKDADFWKAEINQLYHPTGVFGQESQEMVYSQGQLNKTKFIPILLKEWFYLLKKGGYLIVDYQPNQICDWQKLEEIMWWLWRGKYEIIYHGPVETKKILGLTKRKISDFVREQQNYGKVSLDSKSLLPPKVPTISKPTIGGYLRFVVRKNYTCTIKGDDITKWTFGIITDGRKIDWIEQIIASIKRQKIPEFEVIVCGNYFQRTERNFKYIPFNQRDDKGWITRKKNLMAEKAKFENLCFLHDRVVLNDNWYEGMKKWGNCFELLLGVQEFNGKRAIDWLIWERTNDYHLGFASLMDYRDWDKDIYQTGQLQIIKKYIAKEIKWSETHYWGQLEDVYMTELTRKQGYILRLNPHAKTFVLKERFFNLPSIPFNKFHLSRQRKGWPVRTIGRRVCLFFGNNKILRKIILFLLFHFPIK